MKNTYCKISNNIFMDYHFEWVHDNKNFLNLNKIHLIGLPFIEDVNEIKKDIFCFDKTIMYAGSDYYINGQSYINLISAMPDYRFDHFGQIKNKKLFKKISSFSNFKYRGFVSKENIDKELKKHSLLLLFESNYKYSISSKAISYFSSSKTVVCFSSKDKENYYRSIGANNAIYINYDDNIETIKDKIANYKYKDNKIDYDFFSSKQCSDLLKSFLN